MTVTIELPEDLERYADGHRRADVIGSTVGAALDALLTRHPALGPRLMRPNGELFPYLPLFHNGTKLPARAFADRQLSSGDLLEFVVMASGG